MNNVSNTIALPVSEKELEKVIAEFDFYYRRKFSTQTNFDAFKSDAILRVLNNMGKFQEGTNFRAWVSTIYRNAYKSHFTLGKNRVINEDILETDSEGSTKFNFEQDTFKGVDTTVILNEDIAALQGALNSLKNDKVREAVKLFYLEQKSHAEISEILNIDILYSKTLIWRGLGQLKEILIG